MEKSSSIRISRHVIRNSGKLDQSLPSLRRGNYSLNKSHPSEAYFSSHQAFDQSKSQNAKPPFVSQEEEYSEQISANTNLGSPQQKAEPSPAKSLNFSKFFRITQNKISPSKAKPSSRKKSPQISGRKVKEGRKPNGLTLRSITTYKLHEQSRTRCKENLLCEIAAMRKAKAEVLKKRNQFRLSALHRPQGLPEIEALDQIKLLRNLEPLEEENSQAELDNKFQNENGKTQANKDKAEIDEFLDPVSDLNFEQKLQGLRQTLNNLTARTRRAQNNQPQEETVAIKVQIKNHNEDWALANGGSSLGPNIDTIILESFLEQENTSFLDQNIETLSSKINQKFGKNLDSLKGYGKRICARSKKRIDLIMEPSKLAKKQLRADLLLKMKDFLLFFKAMNFSPSIILKFPIKPYNGLHSFEFIEAAKFGNLEVIKDMLYKVSELLLYEFDYLHLTALHWAAKRNHQRCAEELVNLKSYVNARDLYGRTPLFYAVQNKCVPLVYKLLVFRSSPWSNKGYNLIEMAEDHEEVIYYLKKFRFMELVASFQKAAEREEFCKRFIQTKIRIPNFAKI